MLKSIEKRQFILKSAAKVFIKKGFNNVTMQDIIDECRISRGGLYLYFSSVDEIFTEVIRNHNQTKLEKVRQTVKNGSGFTELIGQYLLTQKERLLHMDNSLMLAQYEFFFSHRGEYDRDYFFSAFQNSRDIAYEILSIGVTEGRLSRENADALADTIMFVIEGLGTLAMSCGVTEELLDKQFDFIKKIIFSNNIKKDGGGL